MLSIYCSIILGIAVYTVDTTFTSRIAVGLGVSRIPTIVGFYKERAYHFKGQISKDELKKFINSFLPKDIITEVGSSRYWLTELNRGWAHDSYLISIVLCINI